MKAFCLAISLFVAFLINAQNFIHENSVFECDQAFVIELPLQEQKDPTVFYQYEEQFSFWYRLNANTEESVEITLSPIDGGDHYTVLAFEFDEGDFCQQVFSQKTKPKKIQLLENGEQYIKFRLNTKAGKSYFLCVLNTSFSNCGHELSIRNSLSTLKVKAIHIPCVVPIEEEKKEEPEKLEWGKNSLISFVQLLDQNNKESHVKAEIIIKDPQTKTAVKIDFNRSQKHPLRIEKGKSYLVTCIAPGYKRFEHQLIISDYLKADSSDFDIFLEPLQRGDKFLMSHIYFHPNTYALKREAQKELNYLVNFLENNPDLRIELAGHTNGNNKIRRNKAYKNRAEQWNFKGSSKNLSILRAEEIKRRLEKKRIKEDRISTVGHGGDFMLIQDARTLEAIEKNVRVEVKIY
ncbi:MAG: OmpA family protein [Flavobacteriales bacterium]|nr:OmpA family protein [Flavobacteriales bacterium]